MPSVVNTDDLDKDECVTTLKLKALGMCNGKLVNSSG